MKVPGPTEVLSPPTFTSEVHEPSSTLSSSPNSLSHDHVHSLCSPFFVHCEDKADREGCLTSPRRNGEMSETGLWQ